MERRRIFVVDNGENSPYDPLLLRFISAFFEKTAGEKMAFGNFSMLYLAKLEVIMRMILILWSQREDSCLPVSSSLAHLHGDLVLAGNPAKCAMNLFTA